ncbi:HTH-type transcriptional regulator LysM [Candidatus Anstonella stagnisolia]|nr:HTH-type transcriptional regulator LysM [Candidatus Anstonella stagnisolia]
MENAISVFIGATSDEKVKTIDTVRELLKVPGVQKVWELTGSLDILVLASSPSVAQLNSVVEAVRACKGVRSETTYLVLDSHETKSK